MTDLRLHELVGELAQSGRACEAIQLLAIWLKGETEEAEAKLSTRNAQHRAVIKLMEKGGSRDAIRAILED